MREVFETLKKHWITAWLIIVIVVSSGFFAYAAYTEIFAVKRVVSTQSEPKVLFSSNCMRIGGTRKQMPANAYNVTVCNFDQNFPDMPNPVEIKYTFKARLELKVGDGYYSYDMLGEATDNGGAGLSGDTLAEAQEKFQKLKEKELRYSIQMVEDDAGTISDRDDHVLSYLSGANYEYVYEGQSLTAGKTSTDRFKVMIPAEDMQNTDPEFFVYTEAKPTDQTLNEIYARLYGAVVEEAEAQWRGDILEEDCGTIDYDFYNYILTGNSVGTIDIMWNPEYFEISEFFTSAVAGNEFEDGNDPQDVTVGEETWKKLTLKVNAFDTLDPENGTVLKKGINRYEIQFYKVKEKTSYTGEQAASNYISYKFNKTVNEAVEPEGD